MLYEPQSRVVGSVALFFECKSLELLLLLSLHTHRVRGPDWKRRPCRTSRPRARRDMASIESSNSLTLHGPFWKGDEALLRLETLQTPLQDVMSAPIVIPTLDHSLMIGLDHHFNSSVTYWVQYVSAGST